MIHLEYFRQLVKSTAKKYKDIIINSTLDQLRGTVELLSLCCEKKRKSERKLIKLLQCKKLCAKKISQLLIKHRVLIQSIICVALQVLIKMTSAAIIQNESC